MDQIAHRRAGHILLIIFACVILMQRYRLFAAPLHGDICAYALLGHEMMHGRQLYSDLWERKPPLLYITYAAAELVAGYGRSELFLLGMTASLLSLVLIYQIGKSNGRGNAAGLFAAGFWVLLNCDLDLAANQTDPEVFINVWLLAAFLLLVRWPGRLISPSPGTPGEGRGESAVSPTHRGIDPHPNPLPAYRERRPEPARTRENGRRMAAAVLLGAILCAATLYKHNTAIACLGLLAGHLIVRRNDPLVDRLIESTLAGTAICLIWLGVFGYFADTGRAHIFLDVLFHQNISYSGDVAKNLGNSAALSRIFPSFMIWIIAPALLVLTTTAFWLRSDKRLLNVNPDWLLLLFWALGTWPTVALTGHLFPHYFQLWLPIGCIAGGWAAGTLIDKTARVPPVVAYATITICFVFLAFREGSEFTLTPEEWVHRQFPYFNLVAQNQLGVELGKLLKPDEQFWEMGEDNALYFFSRKSPATGLLFIDPFIFGDEQNIYWNRLLRDLNKSKPALVVMSDNWTEFFPPDALVYPWLKQNYVQWNTPLGWPHYQMLVRRGSDLQRRTLGAAHG